MASAANMIQKVEFSGDVLPHCPFCGKLPLVEGTDGAFQLSPCPHTLFIATDEGFEYRSERFNSLKGIVADGDDEPDIGDDSYDSYTDDLALGEGVKFAVYAPAPSFMGVYYGYAP